MSRSLFENITWTKAGSPHVVTGNATVSEGVTLAIEPGVQVGFEGDRWLGIDGTIVARGTVDSPTVFTSNQVNPAPDDWDEIGFADSNVDYDPATGQGSIMESVIVEYGGGYGADRMLNIDAASPLIKDCILRHAAAVGLDVESGAAPILQNNAIEGNWGADVNVSEDSSPVIRQRGSPAPADTVVPFSPPDVSEDTGMLD